jgi:RNA recognition motif-containing protein
MSMKLFVGSLGYDVRNSDLEEAFAQFGTVLSANVIMDRDTGRSKGFGFVEMSSQNEGLAAIDGMNGQAIAGRTVAVNEARPKEDNRRSFSGGGGGGGRGRR